MNKYKKLLPIVGIMFIAAFLRLFMLGKIPSGFFRDEAAIAYNAYSIWETGRDEYGMVFPLVFRSFEVFFLPLYIYLSAPIVGILGLTEFSSRLLSALAGISLIYLTYLIGKRIWNRNVGLFSAFFLAIAPWHIYYSRGTFEGNLALTLFTAGFYFWLKFTDKSYRKDFFISIILFAFSMYSYQAERLVVPLFSVAAICLSGKKLWQTKKQLILSSLVVGIVLIPLISLSFNAGGLHRATGVSVFSKAESPVGWVEGVKESLMVNNKLYLRGRQLASLYLSYYSPRNLFIEGDFDLQRSVPDYSVFYAFMLPLLIAGFGLLFKNIDNTKHKLLFTWIILAPLPAALTADPFHTYRSLLLYLPLTILIGAGAKVFYDNIHKFPVLKLSVMSKKYIFLLIFLLISSINLSGFIFNYAVLLQSTRARNWDYGYKEIVNFSYLLSPDTKIVVDDPWTEAYIHYLFFGKVNPKDYHNEVSKLGDVSSYYFTDPSEIRPAKLDNIEFRKVDWPTERGDSGVYFIMWHELLPESEYITDPKVELVKTIDYPDGTVAYKIVKIK